MRLAVWEHRLPSRHRLCEIGGKKGRKKKEGRRNSACHERAKKKRVGRSSALSSYAEPGGRKKKGTRIDNLKTARRHHIRDLVTKGKKKKGKKTGEADLIASCPEEKEAPAPGCLTSSLLFPVGDRVRKERKKKKKARRHEIRQHVSAGGRGIDLSPPRDALPFHFYSHSCSGRIDRERKGREGRLRAEHANAAACRRGGKEESMRCLCLSSIAVPGGKKEKGEKPTMWRPH